MVYYRKRLTIIINITIIRGRILEIVEIGADLEPLSWVTGNIMGAIKSGNDGGDPSPVLGKPISLDNTGNMIRSLSGRLFGGDHRDLGEIGQCDGIDRGLL